MAGIHVDWSGNQTVATLFGGDFGDDLVGGEAGDQLTGHAGDDELTGNGGDDTLNGGAGADVMDGGDGDDTFIVDNAGDIVIEASGTGSGTDTVEAGTSYALGANIENLTLTGILAVAGLGNAANNEITGNAGRNVLFGDAGADTLSGQAGNDRLDGGIGADVLSGGQGNDAYFVDDRGDWITEGSGAGSGRDTVFVGAIGYALADGQYIEKMVLGAGVASAYGNDLANTMIGQAGFTALDGGGGDDRLEGRDGDDLLVGGAGSDTLIGGAGADTFRFDALGGGVDTIARFEVGTDRIELAASMFGAGAPPAGGLDAGLFAANALGAASDAGTRLVFNTRTGALFYDADGSGDGAAVQIARVTGAAGLSASDFTIADPDANRAPIARDGALAATEYGSAVTLDLATLADDLDLDDDGASLTYTLNGTVDPSLASISGTVLTFDPSVLVGDIAPGDVLDQVFGVTVTDRHGATATANVTVRVTGRNAAPVAADDTARVDSDDTVTLRIADLLANDTDADGDTLSFASFDASGLLGTLTDNGDGTLTYDPDGAFDGLAAGAQATDSFTYTVSDGAGGTTTATVDVLVEPDTGFADTMVDYDHLFPNRETANSSRTIDVDSGVTFAYRAGSGVSAFVTIVDNQIILSTTAASIGFSQPSGGFHGFRITDEFDMLDDIEGVTANSASVAFDASRISFDANSITFEIGNFALGRNDRVILDVDFA